MSLPAIAAALATLATASATAQTGTEAPKKPAAPSAGLLNDWLRGRSSAFDAWDIGGQLRVRYELFDGGSPAAPNADFQKRGADNRNDYIWAREKLHIGYKSHWVSAFVEGRNSDSEGDDDPRDLGEDNIDLHQAYVSLGNSKEFPLTAKIGRQN